ncbi:MAG: hypothetical protein QW555_07980 [Nitrososphaerota archaeon]
MGETRRYISDDKVIVIKPLNVNLLHLGQFFGFTNQHHLFLNPRERKIVAMGYAGFVVTRIVTVKKVKEKPRVKTLGEKYTQMNYILMVKEEFDKDDNIVLTPIIEPIDGRHHEKLIQLINATGYLSTTYPEQVVSEEFIRNFEEGKILNIDEREVYQRIVNKILEYSDVEEYKAKIIALWIIGTYFHQLFDAYPFLFLYGMWQSGKTKMLTLLSKLCFLGTMDIDISEASFFRMAEDFCPTLLLDETEYLREGESAKTLKKLIYARYKKSGGYVQRVEGERDKQVRNYRVYGPLAIASIRDVDTLIADRCIRLVLLRGLDKEKMNKWPSDEDPDFQAIRDMLYAIMLTKWKRVREIYKDIKCGEMSGREWELWRPLFTIASFVGEDICDIALELSRGKLEAMLGEKAEFWIIKALLSLVQEERWYSNREIREKILGDIVDEEERDELKKLLSAERIGKVVTSLGFMKRRSSAGYEYFLNPEGIGRVATAWGIDTVSPSLETVNGICEYCSREGTVTLINNRYICNECRKNSD